MSESKHTTGPWEEVPQSGAGPMIAHRFQTGNQMRPTGLRLICHMLERGNSIEQDRANASLIAAAPELLEIGEHLLAIFDHPTRSVTAIDADKLRAAVAKAKP